nr:Toll/interleukin-1 receptor (TIR) domain-containing protein [Tanacetum cinerariifolium]
MSSTVRSLLIGPARNPLYGSGQPILELAKINMQPKVSNGLSSKYVFQKEIPIRGYEELARQVVQYADGLPLTIKVLGSFLCGKDKDEWTKDDAIRILECCGFHARIGLKVLEQRSLITILPKYGEYNELVVGMHDHIKEMGKNILRRLHPDEPNKHSRLWIKEEVEDILANDMGTEETRCLKVDTSIKNPRIVMKRLGKMKKLRYLDAKFTYYDCSTEYCEIDGECLGSDLKFVNKSNRYGRIVVKGLGKIKIPKLKVLGKIEQKSERDEATQYFTNSLKFLECGQAAPIAQAVEEHFMSQLLSVAPSSTFVERNFLNSESLANDNQQVAEGVDTDTQQSDPNTIHQELNQSVENAEHSGGQSHGPTPDELPATDDLASNHQVNTDNTIITEDSDVDMNVVDSEANQGGDALPSVGVVVEPLSDQNTSIAPMKLVQLTHHQMPMALINLLGSTTH